MTSAPAPVRIVRFDRVERALHWTNALLFCDLLLTGLVLYGFPGTGWVGNRLVVKDLHVYAGYALPWPVLLAMLAPAGRQVRDDIRRFARWTDDDRRWWRRSTRSTAAVGKFNPGQKLNAVFTGACIMVMATTGIVMRFPSVFADRWRTGADFTHRWFAIALLCTITGHILMSITRPEAMRGILTGRVRASWARHEHPRWAAEVDTNGSEAIRDHS